MCFYLKLRLQFHTKGRVSDTVLPLDFPWNVAGGLFLVECSSCGILRSFTSDEKAPPPFRSVQHGWDWGCRGAQGPALGKPWSAGSPRCQVEVKDRPAGAWPASRNGQRWPGGHMGCVCLPPAQPLPCVRPREDLLEGPSGCSDAAPAVVGSACAGGAVLTGEVGGGPLGLPGAVSCLWRPLLV